MAKPKLPINKRKCHFFVQCGNMATMLIKFRQQEVPVCTGHKHLKD